MTALATDRCSGRSRWLTGSSGSRRVSLSWDLVRNHQPDLTRRRRSVPQMSPNSFHPAFAPVHSRRLAPRATRCYCASARRVATMVRVECCLRIPLGTPTPPDAAQRVARVSVNVSDQIVPELCPNSRCLLLSIVLLGIRLRAQVIVWCRADLRNDHSPSFDVRCPSAQCGGAWSQGIPASPCTSYAPQCWTALSRWRRDVSVD
jgi:hypothetical protein